jgi:hypothetical protein
MKKNILRITFIVIAFMAINITAKATCDTVCGWVYIGDTCSGTTGPYTTIIDVYFGGTYYCQTTFTTFGPGWNSFLFICCGLKLDASIPGYYIRARVVSDQNPNCTGTNNSDWMHYWELSYCNSTNPNHYIKVNLQ